jgi:phosphomevalonate kinase
MRVVAPGKLILTGAYAVLEEAPAIVIAVDRYARADSDAPDDVNVRSLHDISGQKLGLGSSSAAIVASLAARAASRGDDLADAGVRSELFRAARQAHARSQGGGSGADVAAAVHGGALCYVARADHAVVRAVQLPRDLVWAAFWSGRSARTSDLIARVDALRARAADTLRPLRALARRAADAVDAGDARAFVGVACDYARALEALGRDAAAPIVPPDFAELASLAEGEGGAFLPSGAGGGDVGVWLACAPPSAGFVARAGQLSMRPLVLGVDRAGVRTIHPRPGRGVLPRDSAADPAPRTAPSPSAHE